MIDSVFRHEFKQANGVQLTENHILFRKPLELYNLKTDESIKFNSLDDAYEFEIDGKTIKQIITDATMEMFKMHLDGGSGNGSGGETFSFGHAGGDGKDETWKDLPARMNTKIKVKTEKDAIAHFRSLHANDNYESGATITEDGFVTQYVHGNKSSVGIYGRKGELVLHNHPSGGNFSDSDLIATARERSRGIVASGKNGDYIFKKGTHFKANEFVKAVQTATFKGKDYDSAAHSWLKRNQKKYGYKYQFNKVKTKTAAPKIKFDASGQGSFF